jgi:hypothetical protein
VKLPGGPGCETILLKDFGQQFKPGVNHAFKTVLSVSFLILAG